MNESTIPLAQSKANSSMRQATKKTGMKNDDCNTK
jgi:hypothetical protein